jgi:hypothetical protein
MAGDKWTRTCEALRAFVGLLGSGDRVWITLFESSYQDFSEAPMPAPAVLADQGFQGMFSLGTAGGTELFPAALHVLRKIKVHSAYRKANIVLITDGQVGNEATIVQAFRDAPEVRVHTFGIDTAVNDAFLKSLARQQRGWLQTPDDDIAGTIAALGHRLRRPVLTELAVHGAWEAGAERWPDLHAEEIVNIALRGPVGAPLEITGQLPDGTEHRLAVPTGIAGSEAVKLLWAKQRMTTLLETQRAPEAIALAREHNLICEGTAFIAWDEAEQVQVATEEIVQPALEIECLCQAGAAAPMLAMAEIDSEFAAFSRPHAHAHAKRRASASVDDELRDLASKLGISVERRDAWMAWAQQPYFWNRRMKHLVNALQQIEQLQVAFQVSKLEHLLQAPLAQAFSEPPERLIKWADSSLKVLAKVLPLRRSLLAAGCPDELAARLLAWVLAPVPLALVRFKKMEKFVETLPKLPFSATVRAQTWRGLLESTVGRESEAYTIAVRWLPEIATVPEPAPTA